MSSAAPANVPEASQATSSYSANHAKASAIATSAAARGVVYTRDWVVELMLDLAGYDPAADLTTLKIVDPSCGNGAFIRSITRRLIASCERHGKPMTSAIDAVRAYDIDRDALEAARVELTSVLTGANVSRADARRLLGAWLVEADYLLSGPRPDSVDLVIANPPYVRLEHIDSEVSDAYRHRWPTMTGRADLYVGFLEAALTSLKPGGRACVICPDRWMRNQYGRKLRERVDDGYNLDLNLTLHDAPAFERTVSAYPAVVLLRRGPTGPSLAVDARSGFDAPHAETIVRMHARGPAPIPTSPTFAARWLDAPARGSDSWPVATATTRDVVARLEREFPCLGDPDTGTRVGVGIATGADSVFITSDHDLVEPDRMLPLVFSQEITSGRYEPCHRYLVNPWDDDGRLVELDDHPRLRDYYRLHQEALWRRHVAKRQPHAWYRTIDKVDPTLADRPKILLPDLKARVHPVVHPGGAYPQHNLFFVTAEGWDLDVLAALLLSDYATDVLATYSVKMANGCLRVTAQYLRRIRIPRYDDIAPAVRRQLRTAYRSRNIARANTAAARAYRLS